MTALVLGLVASGAIMAYFLFMPMSKTGDTEYVYIDTDDDIDSVMVKVGRVSRGTSMTIFRQAMATTYAQAVTLSMPRRVGYRHSAISATASRRQSR